MSELIERLNSLRHGLYWDVARDAILETTRLQAELEAMREAAQRLDKLDGIDGAACSLIRQKLDEFGAPRAAFIDDHVAAGIGHAAKLAREAALEEAAKVAEATIEQKPMSSYSMMLNSRATEIAAAIRELKGNQSG